MKKLPIIIALLCLALSSRAQIAIYKNKISSTLTGGGITKLSLGGFTIADLDTGEVSQLVVNTKAKTFTLQSVEGVSIANVYDTKRNYLVAIQSRSFTDQLGNLHVATGAAKGAYSNVTINGVIWNIPKTLSWTGRSVYPTGPVWALEESSGSFTLDVGNTQTSDTFGEDVFVAASRLSDLLVSQGYSQQ